MFANLQHVARTFRAPAAGEREMIYISKGVDRHDAEARERNLARGMFARPAFGC